MREKQSRERNTPERVRERERNNLEREKHSRVSEGERETFFIERVSERGRDRVLERHRGILRERELERYRSCDNRRACRRSRERGRDRDRRLEAYSPRRRSNSRKSRFEEANGSSKGGNQERHDEERWNKNAQQHNLGRKEEWTKVVSRRAAKTVKKNFQQNRTFHNPSTTHPNWRDKEDITSFYFTNFSHDVNEVRLWEKFKPWGDVREVFIAKRRNKEGRRFGFVRFKGVSNVKMLETHLDNIFIDDHKLFVNLPRFTRLASNSPTHTTAVKGDKQSTEAVKNLQDTTKPRLRSYVEVVTQNGGSGGSLKGAGGIPTIVIEPIKGRDCWCEGAWVGRLKKPMKLEKMEDYISWELGYNISTRFLGDDMVLLVGLSADKAQKIINSEMNGGNTLFYSLERWRPGYRPSNRVVWLQLWGFPIEAWEVGHMKQVVSTFGDVIEVDEDTDDRRRLDRARVLVRTPLPPAITKEVKVRCGDEDYRVWLVEEVGDDGDVRRTRSSMSDEWTEEITSEEEDAAVEDEDDDTSFSYSPELSATNNKSLSNHQLNELPSGLCGQPPTSCDPVDNNLFSDACRSGASGAERHTQVPCLAKVDQGVAYAEKKQGYFPSEAPTLDPAIHGSREAEEAKSGKFSNCEEASGQQCNTHGEYMPGVTDRGLHDDTGHFQVQKDIGPSLISGPIKKVEECKKKKKVTVTQAANRYVEWFPKVYARQRHGPSKGCFLKPVVEENSMLTEDKDATGPEDLCFKGPNNSNTGEMEKVIKVDENPLEDFEEANQQWLLAKSLGLYHESEQNGIHSFKTMEIRDRKEALQ